MGHATIAETLRAYRETRKWSVQDLATRAGVAVVTIYNVEKGSLPSVATLTAIATALGVTAADLLAGPPLKSATSVRVAPKKCKDPGMTSVKSSRAPVARRRSA
jgi:transcriptional regulator with XRE-family HTH domain